MFERRSSFVGLLTLGLIICIWHLTVQNSNNIDNEIYANSPITLLLSNPLSSTTQNISDAPIFVSPSSVFVSSQTPQTSANTIVSTLPTGDYEKLINLDNFKFQMKPPNSCKKAPLMLVLVHSAPNNFHKRQVIRETWGSLGKSDKRTELLFLLGAVNTTQLQYAIEHESSLYGDILQGNFVDSYRNLTYKHVMALKYFAYYCSESKYLLKTDDDVFINMPFILDTLENSTVIRNLLFCCELIGDRVKRTYRSKWRVSTKEFSDKFYPNHCPGFSILYSADVALKLYLEAQKLLYFWIDDVWVTGTVAQKANISITPTGNYYLSSAKRQQILDRQYTPSSLNFFFTQPNLKEEEIRQLWNIITVNNIKSSIR